MTSKRKGEDLVGGTITDSIPWFEHKIEELIEVLGYYNHHHIEYDQARPDLRRILDSIEIAANELKVSLKVNP